MRGALELEGYAVTAVGNGAAGARRRRRARTPDVVVLDVSMPIVDGLTVCKVLRADGNRVPILMLTARTETRDRVAGLDAGADDYLPKPFELDELLARLRALLRRAQPDGDADDGELVQLADLRLDPAARRAWRGGRELDLSKTEFDLLELLVRNQGVVLDHSTIYDRIWHYDFGPDSKNLAVYIGYLRRKTEADGEARLIQTVRGVGYSARGAEPVSLRWKIALALSVAAIAATTRSVGVAGYRLTSDRLLEEVDSSLDDVSARLDDAAGCRRRPARRTPAVRRFEAHWSRRGGRWSRRPSTSRATSARRRRPSRRRQRPMPTPTTRSTSTAATYRVRTVGHARAACSRSARSLEETERVLPTCAARIVALSLLVAVVGRAPSVADRRQCDRPAAPPDRAPPSTSKRPGRLDVDGRRAAATTRSAGSAPPSTACSARSAAPGTTSGGWSRTPGTSCARR